MHPKVTALTEPQRDLYTHYWEQITSPWTDQMGFVGPVQVNREDGDVDALVRAELLWLPPIALGGPGFLIDPGPGGFIEPCIEI